MARRKMQMSDKQIKFNMKWRKQYGTDLTRSLYATIGRDIKYLSDEEFKSKRSSDWDNYIREYKKWYIRTRKLSLDSYTGWYILFIVT